MFELIAGTASLFLGLAVVFAMAMAIHVGRNWQVGLVPYIFYPVLAVVTLTALTSGRNMALAEFTAAAATHPAAVWLGRLTSLFVLFACGERMLNRLFRQGRKPPLPQLVLIALWAYFLADIVSPGLLGRHRSVSHEYLYVLVAGHAALLMSRAGAELALRSARNGLFLFLLAGALCLAWRPALVADFHYTQGLLPFLHVRMAGLTTGPNSYGPLTVVFMLCLWQLPFRSVMLNRCAWALGIASLVLAQSKTTWLASLACIACIAWFGQREQLRRRINDFRNPQIPVLLLLGLMLSVVVVAYAFMFTGLSTRIGNFFVTREGADLMSMTGRDQIWRIALEEWRHNPIFGYGLSIWNPQHRASIGIPAALHAHSQFYQSLSSAGLIGVIGLLGYAAALLYGVMRTAARSGGLSAALFALILIRSVSEIPLSMTGLSPEQFAHILLLMVLAAYYRVPAAAAPQAASPQSLQSLRQVA